MWSVRLTMSTPLLSARRTTSSTPEKSPPNHCWRPNSPIPILTFFSSLVAPNALSVGSPAPLPESALPDYWSVDPAPVDHPVPSTRGQRSAIHVNRGAGNPGGQIRGQEHGASRGVAGQSITPQWGGEKREQLGILRRHQPG